MPKRQISNLDLKVKLTKEYLDNGGYQKIYDIGLLDDLTLVKCDSKGKVDPNTITNRVNAFMMGILALQLQPPFYSPNHISEYETTLQKSNSFDQENIDTIDQFDRIYKEYKNKTGFLFRGQREAKWRLYSKLQRYWIVDKLNDRFENYLVFLSKLVESGRLQYKQKYIELLGEMHDDADNDISVLSFLQHHGCPTPLLDWTYKFQNALFFALDGLDCKERKREIDNYFSVYFIKEANFGGADMRDFIYEAIEGTQEFALNKMIEMVASDEDTRREMRNFFKGRKAIDTKRIKGSGMISHMLKIEFMVNLSAVYFADGRPDDIVFSLNNSTNIKNQAGVFTWNAHPDKPFELVASDQNFEVDKEDNPDLGAKQYVLCECFNINKKLAGHIRKILDSDGIIRDNIYPTRDFSTWEIYESCIRDPIL